ncbi:hypothetical protein KUCAC02_032065 [Chaenocephalus aceratus]|nr:hypothetical protein KUCAC02_032065 [Chaenocephalus aceratus]
MNAASWEHRTASDRRRSCSPATTLLSNHDLPFFQQLVDSMYCMGADIDSIASASGPGQMEINLRPEFGIAAADTAFTFRTGIKEMARKYSYIASFFTDDGLYNAGVLSHSLWDANGRPPGQQKDFAVPVKLDEALEALSEDHVICSTLGEPFVQYFIAMKKFEIETQELDDERNKCLEYFI